MHFLLTYTYVLIFIHFVDFVLPFPVLCVCFFFFLWSYSFRSSIAGVIVWMFWPTHNSYKNIKNKFPTWWDREIETRVSGGIMNGNSSAHLSGHARTEDGELGMTLTRHHVSQYFNLDFSSFQNHERKNTIVQISQPTAFCNSSPKWHRNHALQFVLQMLRTTF